MSCPFWTRGGWMRRRVFDNPAKRAWWQVHVDAQRESGLTASKYCRQHRLLTRTFQIWRRELTDWEEEKIQIGRAHVWTPVTNAQLVCRLLLEKNIKHYR